MYIGLWSRLEALDRTPLTRALEQRDVIQATLMRSTIHLVSHADFWPFALATRAARRAHYLRAVKDAPSPRALAAAARKLRRALESGPLRRKEIEALVGRERFTGVGLWLDLVRVPPSGTWERRRADLFAAAETWVGPPPELPEADAGTLLVERYLAAFGPASRGDVVSFCGLAPPAVDALLGRLELRRFRSEEGERLLDVPDGVLPDPEAPAPPRFIPTWDAGLLVHARRTGFLPEQHRTKIFHVKAPQSYPTFTVDGAVAGTWRYEEGVVRVSPFEPLDPASEEAVLAEAERLARLHA
jgi:hypothetical protein